MCSYTIIYSYNLGAWGSHVIDYPDVNIDVNLRTGSHERDCLDCFDLKAILRYL